MLVRKLFERRFQILFQEGCAKNRYLFMYMHSVRIITSGKYYIMQLSVRNTAPHLYMPLWELSSFHLQTPHCAGKRGSGRQLQH